MDSIDLRVFAEAVQKFWRENSYLCCRDDYDPAGIEPRAHPFVFPLGQTEWYWYPKHHHTEDQNPAHAPEIQALIKQAVQSRHHSPDDQPQKVFTRHLPLEIVVMIVDLIYNDPDYDETSIDDIGNLLKAMHWKLPDSYWQRRCRKDLIFELQDLIIKCRNDGDDTVVDWAFLCLETEKLLLNFSRYNLSGLRNRERIMGLIRRIKETFLDMSEGRDSA
jgi:hypothetical protein